MCSICNFVVHDGINENSHAVLGQDLKFILMKSWTNEAISLLPEVVSQMFGSSYQSSRKRQQRDLWRIHPGPAHHQWEVYQVEILQPVHIPKWDICFHNVVNRISSIPAQLSPQRTKTKEGRQRSKKGIQLLKWENKCPALHRKLKKDILNVYCLFFLLKLRENQN